MVSQPRRRSTLGCLALLLAVPVVAYAILWLYSLLSTLLDVAAPIVAVLLVALVLAVAGPLLLLRAGRSLGPVLGDIARALWAWLRRTRLVRWIAAHFPRLTRFLMDRLAPARATGLGLTVLVLVASAGVWFFLTLLLHVVTGGTVVGTDTRVINLVATLRTPAADSVMYFITYLGSVPTVLVVTAIAVIISLLRARYEDALLVFLALAASTLFFVGVKLLVARPRPPLEDARIIQGGFSFPSGHSTISAAVYGTIAYLLIRSVRREWVRALVAVGTALLVLAIGVSRVYLGVHYPSDVVAAWTAGALWVLLVIATEDIWPSRVARPLPPRRRAFDATAALVLVVLGIGLLAADYRQLPSPPVVVAPSPEVILVDAVPTTVENQLPHYTEGLFGSRQEPVSLLFVGTRAEIEGVFRAAGWTEATPFGLGSVVSATSASISGRGDPAGPVTPSFLGDEPNALAFSLPVGKTFAQRHHIRLWTTTVVTSGGLPIWEATASFDEGFELAPRTGFPTHRIAPDIDTERTFIVGSLVDTGRVSSERTIQLVPAERGRNFAGDPFFTDGQAIILGLDAAA